MAHKPFFKWNIFNLGIIFGIILILIMPVHSLTSEKASWTDAERKYYTELQNGGSFAISSNAVICDPSYYSSLNLTQSEKNILYLTKCSLATFHYPSAYNFKHVTYHKKEINRTHWY